MASLLEGLGLYRRAPDPRPPGEIEGDILDELRFHLEEATDELTRDGVPPEEARAEARRRFGNFEAVRFACRKAQMGERIMIQRINLVLLLVLLAGLFAVGGLGLVAQRRERAALEVAHARMAEMHHEMTDITRMLESRPPDVVARSAVEAMRELGFVQEAVARVDPDAPLSPDEVPGWLGRFQEDPQSWRHGLAVGYELAELPPDRALELLGELWGDLPLPHREQIMKPFVFHGGSPEVIGVLALGVNDEQPSVRARALLYLKTYAFADLSGDLEGAHAWFERWGDEDLGTLLTMNARSFVHRMKSLTGDGLAIERRTLGELDLRPGGVAGIDLAGVLREEGLVELLGEWIGGRDPEAREIAVGWLAELRADWEVQSSLLLPILASPEVYPESVPEACAALGHPENTWAVRPLVDFLIGALEEPPGSRVRSFVPGASSALAEIGDPIVIPELIGMIAADGSHETIYGIGHFGLRTLTGVAYDQSHDGAWWLDWWSRNQDRLSDRARLLEVPSFRFDH